MALGDRSIDTFLFSVRVCGKGALWMHERTSWLPARTTKGEMTTSTVGRASFWPTTNEAMKLEANSILLVDRCEAAGRFAPLVLFVK